MARRGPAGVTAIWDPLCGSSRDEASTEYGLIAETIEWPEDRSWVAFTLRPQARFHDGSPITVEDVIFTFDRMVNKDNAFQKAQPQSFQYASDMGLPDNLVKLEQPDPMTVFDTHLRPTCPQMGALIHTFGGLIHTGFIAEIPPFFAGFGAVAGYSV